MLEWVQERLDPALHPDDWDRLLSQATADFFPKVTVALPDDLDARQTRGQPTPNPSQKKRRSDSE